jgi:hypothetical protein
VNDILALMFKACLRPAHIQMNVYLRFLVGVSKLVRLVQIQSITLINSTESFDIGIEV